MQSKIENLAKTIDQATDNGDIVVLNEALTQIEAFKGGALLRLNVAQLYFFAANCYASIRIIDGENNRWAWKNKNLEDEIYNLRLALSVCNSIPFKDDGSDLRFRVGTNLANALNHVGRFVEAIETWDGVLNAHPEYAMAVGNRGYCLSWYARYLYDSGHQPIFLNESYREIRRALELGVEEHAALGMREWMEHLTTIRDWGEFKFEPKGEPRGRSKLEQAYRTWCIDNRLFLNPLNDIGKKT